MSVGVVLAALLFMRRMAEITARAPDADGRGTPGGRRRRQIPDELRSKVAVYEIAGPLFFGAAQKAMASLGIVGGRIKVLIVRLDHVPVMDATGLVALESAIATLTKHGCTTVLIGLQPQPRALIERAGLAGRSWLLVIEPDLPAALAKARALVPAT